MKNSTLTDQFPMLINILQKFKKLNFLV